MAYYYLTKFVLGRANIITSDSLYMTEKIKEFSKNAYVLTFPFGINNIPTVDKKDKNYKYFFSNRALENNYNVKLVIDVFYSLWLSDNTKKLFIAHDGNERLFLEKYVTEKGLGNNVIFLGYLSEYDMAGYYKKCGYYFSLPISDSTSVSLIEAMSYGCIPIVSDIPANTEWITDKRNGFIFGNDLFIQYLPNAFDINREIIEEQAIWPKTVEKFCKGLNYIKL